MLITRKKTITEDVQTEVKAPAYYSKGGKAYMLCENGDIVIVNPPDLIVRWKSTVERFHGEALDEMLCGGEITMEAFDYAYESVIKSVNNSILSTQPATA